LITNSPPENKDAGKLDRKKWGGSCMSDKTKFSKLFSPIKIGTLQVKNRIMMAPMVTRQASDTGFFTEKEKDYFLRRAMGGVGLITIGDVLPAPNVQVLPAHVALYDDKFIPGWRDFAIAIHDAGALLSAQLSHGGNESRSDFTGQKPVAPSAVFSPVVGEIPHELTIEEIREVVQGFAAAAVRAKNAGVDMVEIQGSQGFLLHNFMTPIFNKRTDEYGVDLKGRTRVSVEIIKGIKEKAGSDFPVSFRMVASDAVDGGLTVEDTKMIAQILVESGADAIHLTAGLGLHYMYLCIPPVDAGMGCIVDLAEKFNHVVDVPVIVAQRIVDPMQAEEIIRKRKADMVSLGRALICDPDWPKKALEGDQDDIVKCIGCGNCLDRRLGGGTATSIVCTRNPTVGKEKEYVITRAKKIKKVLVVGGGIAGLEAARVASLRGHKVSLIEKTSELGGQWNLACVCPKKDEYKEVISYYVRQLKNLNVKVEFNKVVDSSLVSQLTPDVVVIATGAAPIIPDIPGADGSNVITAHALLSGVASSGQNNLVIGGGLVGCETADFLVELRKNVTIVEMLEEIAKDESMLRKPYLMKRLTEGNVQILTFTKVREISPNGVIAVDKDGQEKNIGPYDTIILAVGAKPVNQNLTEQLKSMVPQVYVVGDAVEARLGIDAIADGYRIGMEM